MPVTIRMMSESMAISPTMNDQWSGKILSRTLVRNFEEPKRSSTVSRTDFSDGVALLRSAGSLLGGAHQPRFQNPGPTGSV